MEKSNPIDYWYQKYQQLKEEAQDFYGASLHLAERVDQYLVQGCSRAELKAANDALKKLMEL